MLSKQKILSEVKKNWKTFLVGVGTGVVILKNNQVLLNLRNKEANNRIGEWELPGGTAEFGDTIEETVIKEVKEETNLTVKPLHCVCVHQDFVEGQHWISFGFVAELISGKLKNLEPHKFKEIKFFDLTKLPENTSKLSKEVIESFKSGKKIEIPILRQ